MTVDKILLDDDAITKIAAKILDKISGKQSVICQGYYCDNEKEPDSSKQWDNVLTLNKLKLNETALARVASMPLTQDEIEQVAIELKTRKRTTDTVSEEEADTAVRKVLADNVLISRAVQKKTMCIPSGPRQYCSPGSGYELNLNCAACGPNSPISRYVQCVCGPNSSSYHNFNCSPGSPNIDLDCAVCSPRNVKHYTLQCGGGHYMPWHDWHEQNGDDIIRLSEQVAQLAVEIKKLQAGK